MNQKCHNKKCSSYREPSMELRIDWGHGQGYECKVCGERRAYADAFVQEADWHAVHKWVGRVE
jgi:hypothetical protein